MKYKYNGQWYNLNMSSYVENALIGEVIEFAGQNIPGGYLICDGSAVSRTEYSELFNVIGTTYGSGDGSTTFNLPNLKGKTIMGLDPSNTDFNIIGKNGGSLTHRHDFKIGRLFNWGASIGDDMAVQGAWSYEQSKYSKTYGNEGSLSTAMKNGGTTVSSGGDVSDRVRYSIGDTKLNSSLSPYITLNYIIRAKNNQPILATVSHVINSLDNNSSIDAPSISIVNQEFMKKARILYTNTNTTTGYDTKNITLSDSNYDYLIWIFESSVNSGTITPAVISPKGMGARIYFITTEIAYRNITRNSDISFTVGVISSGVNTRLNIKQVIGIVL